MVIKGDTYELLNEESSTKLAETDKIKVKEGIMIEDVKIFIKLICS